VNEYPVFFDGNRVDRIINAGQQLPAGCEVNGVVGVRMCTNPWRECSIKATGINGTGFGFHVEKSFPTDKRSLQTLVHVWHDGVTDIRVRVMYYVSEPAGCNCEVPGVTQTSP
jgi:hypothetical protein